LDIIVDPRFRDKIPKLNPEEYRQLEENILSDGEIRDPLILWRGYNILIDGHNRWKIYQAHSDVLPFPGVRELPFEDENAAVDWMLMNQLGRRNLNEMQITALRGQLYKTMKKAVGAPQGNKNAEKQCTQNGNIESDEPRRVSEQMANRLGIGKNTVIRAEQFLDGLDAAEAVVPGFKDEILSGQTKARQADVAELRKAEPEQIAERVEEIRKPKVTFPSGNVSKPKKLSPAAQEIAENDKRTTDKNAVVEYGIDDLLEDLRMLQNDFVDKYHHAIDLHMDVATDNGKKVLALMKEFETEWKEIKERVR
jgi:hypothetical protein